MTNEAILVIEDDPEIGLLFQDLLADGGYTIRVLESAVDLAAVVRRERPQAVVLEMREPDGSALQALRELKADPPTATVPVVVVVTSLLDLPRDALSLAAAVVTKPFGGDAFLSTLRAAVAGNAPSQASLAR